MRLQRIYSSKLYVTSTRKDKIHAAIQDPINVELVQQIEDYLSDEAKTELNQVLVQQKEDAISKVNPADKSAAPSGNSSYAPSGGGASHSAFTGDIMSDFGDDDLADVEIPEDMGGDDVDETSEPVEPEAVESVTQEGKPITSSTAIIWTTLDDVVADCETIKGTLNAREDTTGVTRLEVKDKELWVYYNDDTNLNDKMVEVISVLNSTGYTYLKFNRLARSNNAIVFDISLNFEQIKPKAELEAVK